MSTHPDNNTVGFQDSGEWPIILEISRAYSPTACAEDGGSVFHGSNHRSGLELPVRTGLDARHRYSWWPPWLKRLEPTVLKRDLSCASMENY